MLPRLILGAAAFLLAGLSAAVAQSTDLVRQGEYVARAADCVACHSIPDGQAFAGGLKMGTPLGAIYTTNITPDPETGIGRYSAAEFDRAVRQGIARDGRHLYPAMPYPSYAKLSDADVAALYAYFMKAVPAAHQPDKPTEIASPWNMRWPLAVWNLLFVDSGPYSPKPDHDPVWNRGAYLVQGPGHCGACHTVRGVAFQEKALDERDKKFLGGATLDGWTAPSLRGEPNSGLGRWSEQDVVDFLKEGRNSHGSVFGSMLEAYNNSTQFMSDADLTAIARYLKTLPGETEKRPSWSYDDTRTVYKPAKQPGAATYLAWCAGCHAADGKGQGRFLPPLAGNPVLLTDDATSVINLILNGTGRVVTGDTPDPLAMRPNRLWLTDPQIAEVTNFVRNAWGNQAPNITEKDVATLRASTDMASDKVIVLRMR